VIAFVLLLLLTACIHPFEPGGTTPEFSEFLQVDTGYTDKGGYWWSGHLSTFTLHWQHSDDAFEYQIRMSPAPINQGNWGNALVVASAPGDLDSCLVPVLPEVYGNTCVSCGLCVNACPQDAMALVGGEAVIDASKCTACGECVRVCPVNAISDSRFNQAYYFAVRAFSETGVPSAEVASTVTNVEMIYKNDEGRCGRCNDGETSTCYIVLEEEGPGCPVDAIYWDEEFLIYIDYDLCIYCGQCFIQCRAHPTSSISKYVQ